MFSLLVLICTIITVIHGAVLEGRIVGGENTTIEEHPYQLAVENRGAPIGGASIISTTIALTAAHVTDGKLIEKIEVRAGSTRRGRGGQVRGVSAIAAHPKYNPINKDYDVAILRLKTPLNFGTDVQPISLNSIGVEARVGQLCSISGWGKLSSDGDKADILQTTDVPKITTENCRLRYPHNPVTQRMICYGYENGGKDACTGDSGGPLACDGVLFGVISWGRGCGSDKPGVYAQIANEEIHSFISNYL